MKIYSIRDRLLDHFMPPFVGQSDHQVKAAVAAAVNGDTDHAIANAPHQFELWKLAEVNEQTGQVAGDREYLCDLSALVRGGIRHAGDAAAATLAATAHDRAGAAERSAGGTRTDEPPSQEQAPPEGLAPAEARRGPGVASLKS